MKKLFAWVIGLLILAGLLYVVVEVPFGGRTLLDRMFGRAEPSATSKTTESDKNQKSPPTAKHQKKDTDTLTEHDRQDLDKLIDGKLQKEGGEPASPKKP
jgi:hypothetical protein